MPAYNAGPWIAESIASVFAQTHSPCELIVVNDGSTDDTESRAQEALTQAPPTFSTQLLSQTNGGASRARNQGLQAAQGEFIQFLDADDLLSPRKIELQVLELNTQPAGRVASCRWGRFTHDPSQAAFVDQSVFQDFEPMEWLLLHASQLRMMHPAAWLTPQSVAKEAGPWDESLSLNDDGEYFGRVVLASTGIRFCAEEAATTHYRSEVGGSLSGRKSPTALQSLFRTGELLETHILAKEDSTRTRQAIADHWQHLCYELYPGAPALSRQAELRAGRFGGSSVTPPLGSKQALLARFTGWRFARRLGALLR
jgi:glycosyltransferase involved in cell wall biosynthesis